jgi:hypothetical protein
MIVVSRCMGLADSAIMAPMKYSEIALGYCSKDYRTTSEVSVTQIPKTSGHRTKKCEPDSSSSARNDVGAAASLLFVCRFRREGGDDFLEARIATQRVPDWL